MDQATEPGPEELAGLGNRTAAFVIDSVLLSLVTSLVVVVPLFAIVAASESAGFGSGGVVAAFVLFQGVSLVLFYGYHIALEGLYGYTLGKKLVDIRVVTEDGGDIGWFEAGVRNLLLMVDNLPFAYLLGIGLILYDDDEQRLGDMAASTYVVHE